MPAAKTPSPPARHRPRKRFGQHFLHDPFVIDRIVAAIRPEEGQQLVEVGPGLGALTRALLPVVKTMDAIELDREVIPHLEREVAGLGTLHVHSADVLEFDFCGLCTEGRTLRVVGNLPYNISTPLLFHLLEQQACIADMHFMVQKEVAERLAAAAGSAGYGRLSVMVQYKCAVERLFNVGPGAFSPAPKVSSALVRLRPHSEPPVYVADEARFARLVAQAFSRRRKTLRNALKGLLTPEDIAAQDVDPGLRPERLTIEEFARLSNCMQ